MENDLTGALETLTRQWENAKLIQDPHTTGLYLERIFSPQRNGKNLPLHLLLKGSNFQIKVWEALIRIPPGTVVSYEDVAEMIGSPKAVRAVANAVAHNPVSFIIPCHRVIRKSGAIHEYRWGSARKKAILGWESQAQPVL
jgi:AraC family transcriptional regulator of adaptative response/methylated-DNA-[protein]-cysteine methyltransferase